MTKPTPITFCPAIKTLRWVLPQDAQVLDHLKADRLIRSRFCYHKQLAPTVNAIGIVCEWYILAN